MFETGSSGTRVCMDFLRCFCVPCPFPKWVPRIMKRPVYYAFVLIIQWTKKENDPSGDSDKRIVPFHGYYA